MVYTQKMQRGDHSVSVGGMKRRLDNTQYLNPVPSAQYLMPITQSQNR